MKRRVMDLKFGLAPATPVSELDVMREEHMRRSPKYTHAHVHAQMRRRAVWLLHIEGHTLTNMAQAFNVSPERIRSMIERYRKDLI